MLIACRNWISIFRGLRVCVYIYVLLHIFFFFSVLLREVIKKPHVYNARRGELSCFRREISTRTTRIFLFSYYSEEGRWSESFLLNFFFLFFSVNWPTSIEPFTMYRRLRLRRRRYKRGREKKKIIKNLVTHMSIRRIGGGAFIYVIYTRLFIGGEGGGHV